MCAAINSKIYATVGSRKVIRHSLILVLSIVNVNILCISNFQSFKENSNVCIFTGEGINRSYFLILVPIGVLGNTLSFLVSLELLIPRQARCKSENRCE